MSRCVAIGVARGCAFAGAFVVVLAPGGPPAARAEITLSGAASVALERVTLTYEADGSFLLDQVLLVRPSETQALEIACWEGDLMSVKKTALTSVDGGDRKPLEALGEHSVSVAPPFVLVSDDKIRVFSVPRVPRGALVECQRVERHESPLTWGGVQFDRDVLVDSVSVRAVVRAGAEIQWLLSPSVGIAGSEHGRAAGDTVIEWTAGRRVPSAPAPCAPDGENSVLRIVPVRSRAGGELLDLASWDGFARWEAAVAARALARDPGAKSTRGAAAAPPEPGGASAVAIADSLYRHVQDSFRYVAVELGIGGWVPRDASDVIAKRFGDCKGLSAALVSLLGERGVPARLALARAGSKAPLDPALPSPSWFNHVIVAVPLADGAIRFYDPTSPHTTPGKLPWMDLPGPFLLIDGEGGGRLVTPSADQIVATRIDLASRIDVQPDLRGSVTITLGLSGYEAERWHAHLAEGAEARDALRGLWIDPLLPRSASLVTSSIVVDRPDSVALRAEYSDPQAARDLAGGRLFVRVPSLPDGGHLRGLNAEPERREPIRLAYPFHVVSSAVVRLPPGRALTPVDSLAIVECVPIRYVRREPVARAGGWERTQELEVRTIWVDAAGAEDFATLWREISRAISSSSAIVFSGS